jgi:hypothetical protein
MQPPSSPSSVITAPLIDEENAWRLGKLIAESKLCRLSLLHYDSYSKSMVEWCWWDPTWIIRESLMMAPLQKTQAHQWRGQEGCTIRVREAPQWTVYPWWDKTTRTTYWNPRCASDTCRYHGQSSSWSCPITRTHINCHPVKMDKYFQLAPWVTYQYPQRGMNSLL